MGLPRYCVRMLRNQIAFGFRSFGYLTLGVVLALNACGGSSGTTTGTGGTGGGGKGGAGGGTGGGAGGGAGGGTGGGAGGHGGTGGTAGAGGTVTDGSVDVPMATDGSTDGPTGIAWRAFLPLATAATEVDGGAMGTSNDTSGHGYNATFYGSTVTFANSSLNLTGAGTEQVVIPAKSGVPAINVAGSFSVSAWVNFTNPGGFQTFVGGEGYNISSFFLQKRGDSNAFAFTITGGDSITAPGGCLVLATVLPVANQWYHVVGTRDGSTGENVLYVDGVESGARQTCSSGWMDTGIMGIGHGVFAGGRTDHVNGAIAEVGLIDRVLTASEVADLHTKGVHYVAPTTGTDGGTDGAGGDASAD
jgi:hypothetical protein